MSKNKFVLLIIVAFFAAFFVNAETKAQTSSVFAVGLKAPAKIIYAPRQDFFLVSEAGIASVPNSGRVSIITDDGSRYTLIDGLPSGPGATNGASLGPSALWLDGDSLYIAIGNGNATVRGPAPGTEIPNPTPNSPIFSSVLEFSFPSGDVLPNRFGYEISVFDHTRLANGETLVLGGFGQQSATLRLAANLPDFTPSPRPDVPNNVHPHNPFGLVKVGDELYVADAGQNNVQTVYLRNGFSEVFFAFPPRTNPAPPPPAVEAVPSGLRLFGNKLLVPLLTGFPFPAGLAEIRQIDLETGAESQLIGGLRMAIDVLPLTDRGFRNTFYTLEYMSSPTTPASGRIQHFSSPGGQPTVIVNNLAMPTGMALHPNGDLLVTETFAGRITRISNVP